MKKIYLKIKYSRLVTLAKDIFTLGGKGKTFPSSLTYYVLLSFIPFLIIETFILKIVQIPASSLTKIINTYFTANEVLTENVVTFIENFGRNSLWEWIIVLAMSTYFSSRGVECFLLFSNQEYGEIHVKEKYFIRKAKCFIVTAIESIVFAVLMYFLIIFNNSLIISNIILSYIINEIVLLLFLIVFSTFIYAIPIRKKGTVRQVIPGSLFASLGIGIGVNIYTFFLKNFTSKEKIYGPFASIIVLLLTIYFVSYIIMMGVRINVLYKFYVLKKDNKNDLIPKNDES